MRKFVLPLAAFLALGLCLKVSQAQSSSDSKEHRLTGVLIDEHCAGKFAKESNPAKAAADHKAACAVKCAKGGAAIVFLTNKKEWKLDKHGQELAMAWLQKDEAKTRVRVIATENGDELQVSKIEAARERGSSSSSSQTN